MGQAISVVVVLLCLAGAFAALYQWRPRTEGGNAPKASRWWLAALCSVTMLVAVVVATMYLQA